VATILTFSAQGADPRRAAPRAGARAEIIVFPRTDIRALRRWSEVGDTGSDRSLGAPGEKDPA